jgi:hypothetical protein
MAGELAGFSRDNARLILDVVRYLRANGLIAPGGDRGQQTFPPQAPIYVRNDSGVEIPAFACLQVTPPGTVEAGGQNYITVDQPADTTGAAGGYLFNGQAPIEIGGYGIAHDGPVVRMLHTGSPVSGDRMIPVVASWSVAIGLGPFVAIGDDDIEPNVIRGFITPSQPERLKFIRFELTAELLGTTTTADIFDADGVSIEEGATLEDPETIFTGLTATTRGIGIQQGARYFIYNANCPAEEE